MRPTTGCLDAFVGFARTILNLEFTVHIAAVNVKASRGVQRDVFERVLPFVNGHGGRGCASNEDGKGGVVVTPVGVRRHVLVGVDGERHGGRADHHVSGNGPVDKDPFFSVWGNGWNGFSKDSVVGRFYFHDGGRGRKHPTVLGGEGETQHVAREGIVADGGAQRGGVAVSCSLNDDRTGLSDEVHAHDAQILNDGGGADYTGSGVVDHHAVAGVVVARRRIVDLIGHVEGNLCLPVVVRCRVEDGACNLVAKLQVGVLDGDARGTCDAVADGHLFNGVWEGGGGGRADRDLRVAATGRRGGYHAVGIGRTVGLQNPINGEASGVDNSVPNASAYGRTVPIESEVHAGSVPLSNLVRIVTSGVGG